MKVCEQFEVFASLNEELDSKFTFKEFAHYGVNPFPLDFKQANPQNITKKQI